MGLKWDVMEEERVKFGGRFNSTRNIIVLFRVTVVPRRPSLEGTLAAEFRGLHHLNNNPSGVLIRCCLLFFLCFCFCMFFELFVFFFILYFFAFFKPFF